MFEVARVGSITDAASRINSNPGLLMLSKRTLASLAQLLELYDPKFVIVLLSKHDIRISVEDKNLLFDVNRALRNQAESPGIIAIVEEITRTQGDLRSRITPRYRFDERFEDLSRCLLLDGYKTEGKAIVPLDPSIPDTPPIEDELVQALANTGLDSEGAIRRKLADSAEAFRRIPPNFNACMNDARVALESLVREVANRLPKDDLHAYDPPKWGSMLTFLRLRDFLSLEEEQGLAGVYRFLSPGSHRPLGLSEAEMSRLGRAIAMSMCWFIAKRHAGLGSV